MQKTQFEQIIEKYDNIIFDYGGIFINIEYDLTVQKLTDLSELHDASIFYTKKKQIPLFSQLEQGQIAPEHFLVELCKLLQIDLSKKQEVISAWNAMLLDIPVERYEYLKELAKRKRIFLLSNINKIHEDFLAEYIKGRTELNGFYEVFEKVYFSHDIGLRKPNAGAFEYVLNDAKLEREKTLFIDDSNQHVEGAKSIKLDAILLSPPNTFITK